MISGCAVVMEGVYGLQREARRWRKGNWHWVFHTYIIPSVESGLMGDLRCLRAFK